MKRGARWLATGTAVGFSLGACAPDETVLKDAVSSGGSTGGSAITTSGTGGSGGTDSGSAGAASGTGGSGVVTAGSGGQATAGSGGQPSMAGSSSVPEPPPIAAAILLVVGDNNGTLDPGELSPGDEFTIERLEQDLGHTVTTARDTAARAELVAAAEASDLTIVAESVASANLQDKLRPVEKPILSFEAFIQDEMGLTALGPPGDPGEPADFALGVKAEETRIDIVDPEHPLAAGFNGTVIVYQQPRSVNWGTVADTAEVVATLPGDPAGAAIYLYRQGTPLFDGELAAGLRLMFFLEDDDEVSTPNVMTEAGLALFDRAVSFALVPEP